MSAREMYLSREGAFGLGGSSFRRSFLVTDPVDSDGNQVDPRFDADLPRIGTSVVGLQGATVRDYDLVTSHGPKMAFVDVLYDIPTELLATYGGQWQVAIDGGLETQRVATEFLSRKDRSQGKVPKIIGPNNYHKARSGQTPTHTIVLTGKNADGTNKAPIQLVRDDDGRIEVGADRQNPVVTITASKRFVGETNATRFLYPLGTVNDGTFTIGGVRFARTTLLYLTASIQDEIGVAGVTPPPFIDHVVRLTFAWSGDGWQHDVVHKWTGIRPGADEGETEAEYIITDSKGKAVHETFQLQPEERGFNGMLS